MRSSQAFPARIFIPTPAGTVEILSITRRQAGGHARSVVLRDQSFEPLRMSGSYRAFTSDAGPLALADPDQQAAMYILQLTHDIDSGDSWNLPVLLAHLLRENHDSLADVLASVGKTDDMPLLFATGSLAFDPGRPLADQTFRAETYALENKMAAILSVIEKSGQPAFVLLPASAPESELAGAERLLTGSPARDRIRYHRCRNVGDALAALRASASTHGNDTKASKGSADTATRSPAGQQSPATATKAGSKASPSSSVWKKRSVLAGLVLVLMAAGGFAALQASWFGEPAGEDVAQEATSEPLPASRPPDPLPEPANATADETAADETASDASAPGSNASPSTAPDASPAPTLPEGFAIAALMAPEGASCFALMTSAIAARHQPLTVTTTEAGSEVTLPPGACGVALSMKPDWQIELSGAMKADLMNIGTRTVTAQGGPALVIQGYARASVVLGDRRISIAVIRLAGNGSHPAVQLDWL
ncbi:hypothetical protein HDIA_3355 [Hartmannibacter diazotrophicus]|uniref:Uncharacterized protein n=1 Tax=Hartmannibacter diazotrophicus TaxID=1482074 RepID=A0A2C9D9E9_9HYPH|nr:hypothetical protein [Hartmannibacter diazotrophicus]SON56896.1 hypothetical protein HDIA_3355 [Hartmannibacter diazotrophicus]